MKYKVIFLPGAERNLADIDEYLNRFYPSTIVNFFKKLDKKLLLLHESPYIGAVYTPNPKFHRLIVDDYLVFYVINENDCNVEIYRILHGAQDITQYLQAEN